MITIESIARIVHEANRAYCKTINDYSQLGWLNAAEWQREGMIKGVKFKLANPDTTPQQMHENWLKDKIADGWVYGKVKDISEKTHPCILPYDQLPEQEKVKDYISTSIIKGIVSSGIEILQ